MEKSPLMIILTIKRSGKLPNTKLWQQDQMHIFINYMGMKTLLKMV